MLADHKNNLVDDTVEDILMDFPEKERMTSPECPKKRAYEYYQ